MKRRKILPVIIGLLFLSVFCVRFLAASPLTARPPVQEENFLQNPGFEGGFHSWNGIPEIQVAAKWTPWWWEDNAHDPPYFRPEYKRALAAFYPNRVLSGESAQQWFTFHASHFAGMYQQVFDVRPGQLYRFTIWAQVWSSVEDNPYTSVLPANPHLKVGIDPTGFWNAGSPDVIWSPEAPMSSIVDQWGQVSVEARAQGNIITVFMLTRPEFANKHNDMYWDHASLVAISAPAPTSYPPTNTSNPTNESSQTVGTLAVETTPLASSTPVEVAASPAISKTTSPPQTPSSSKTPLASKTPKPTQTASRTATATSTDPVSATATLTMTPTSKPTRPVGAEQNSPGSTNTRSRNTTSPGTEFQKEEEEPIKPGRDRSTIFVLFGIGLLVAISVVLIFGIVRRNRAS